MQHRREMKHLGKCSHRLDDRTIAIALGGTAEFSETEKRDNSLSISGPLEPRSTHAHAGTDAPERSQSGDKLCLCYKERSDANYGQLDQQGDARRGSHAVLFSTAHEVTRPHVGNDHAGTQHHQFRLRDREDPATNHHNAGFHSLRPFVGRLWQIRAEGTYQQRVLRAKHTVPPRHAVATPIGGGVPTPGLPTQLVLAQ